MYRTNKSQLIAVKTVISDKSFKNLLGGINLPSFLIDIGLKSVLKSNYDGQKFIEEGNNVINLLDERDSILNQLENIGVQFIKFKNYIASFTKVNIEEKSSILLTIHWSLETGQRKAIVATTKAYKKEFVNHVVTKKELSETKEQSSNLIKKQALKMKAIIDSGTHMIWSVNKSLSLTSFNQNYTKVFENTYSEKPALNVELNTIEHSKNELPVTVCWNEKYKQAFRGKTVFFEYEFLYIDGSIEYKEIYLNPLIDEQGAILEVSGIGIDVTERKLAQRKLNKNTVRYNIIFNNSAAIIWSLDASKKVTACNKSFEIAMRGWFNRLVSINSDFVDYFDSAMDNSEAIKVFNKNFQKALTSKKQLFEIHCKDINNKSIYLEIYMSPICYEVDVVSEISCIAIDVTETKFASNELSESLKEKETLLQEVHHRVKNNLQIISSILNLQASYLKDENALSILMESQNRIKSMSFIHESLYINNNFRYINFSDYISSLTRNLIQSYTISPGKVDFDSHVDDVQLNIDQAIPCGLILNELISNALKYAFPNGQKGKIKLNISEDGDNVKIVIQDNGVGFPDDFDIEKSESLGLQLVFILVEQLDGNIEIESNKGSKFLINFDKIKNS
ncbi:MAG: two-component sensor histidine kinase [Urechidicola sp.]